VLRDVTWRVRPGERWLVIGANGAGKTQLLKVVAGAVWPQPTGRERRVYRWRGAAFRAPQGVLDAIAYIGPERQDRHDRYGWNATVERVVGTGHFRTDIPLDALTPAARRAIRRCLRQLGIEALAARRFLTLSYGERRLALIARAVASRPKLLLLDEIFTGLDAHFRARVAAWVQRISRSDLPWALAAHRAIDIPEAVTHAIVLDRGRVAYRGRLMRAPIEKWFLPARAMRRSRVRARTGTRGALLVRLEHASVFADAIQVLKDLTFEVHSGDCWVVHGGNGAGKTTLIRTLYGDHGVASGGTVLRDGIEPGVALEAFKVRVGLVAPHLQTDHPPYLAASDVVVSGLRASVCLAEPASAVERRAARAALGRLGIARLASRRLGELSYGQVRRVLFARALVGRPRLLLFDEPYAGLDPRSRAALRAALEMFATARTAVVIATHHRDEWPACATHELELERGRAVYCGGVRANS